MVVPASSPSRVYMSRSMRSGCAETGQEKRNNLSVLIRYLFICLFVYSCFLCLYLYLYLYLYLI